ncbi:MAG: SufE family protein [Gammaproteobacteria bacterium]|nr:MAG: SufE family protein [Gammaproteobacteria bacterium]
MSAATTAFDQVPFGRSIDAEEVAESLEFFDDWEDRYRYIIDLGKELPGLPDDLKTEDRFIHGCQSQVWVDHRREPHSGRLQFVVDSDALIVRGLAGIVLSALNDRTPDEIAAFDVDAFFDRIDLMRHISPTRGNGLRAMVQKIRDLAQAA